MIYLLAPEYGNIELDYGYSIMDDVPLKYKLAPIIKRILGIDFYQRIILLLANKKQIAFNKLLKSKPSLKDYISVLETIDLPVNIGQLKKSDFLSPLLIEAGFFLKEMDNYISYD
jgi:hypothetical protein